MIDVLLITRDEVVGYLSNSQFISTYDYDPITHWYPGEFGRICNQRILVVPADPSICSSNVLYFLLGASVIRGDTRLYTKYKSYLNIHKAEIEVNRFIESF